MYACQYQSPNVFHATPVGIHVCSLHLFLYFCFANKIIYTIFLDSTYMHKIIYNICFSLSDLLHSLHWSLGPSTALQMAQFQSFFYGWVIFHYIYVLHLLYPFFCWWTFRLLPCPGIVNSAAMNIELYVSLELWFSQGICPIMGLLSDMIVLFLVF